MLLLAKPKVIVLGALISFVVVAGAATIVARSTAHGQPAAALQAADRFAADYANPNGIDSNNRISDGLDTTPQLTATITKQLQAGYRAAGFAVTGAATPSGDTPLNVTIPTDHGAWRVQVVDVNGRWLVAQA